VARQLLILILQPSSLGRALQHPVMLQRTKNGIVRRPIGYALAAAVCLSAVMTSGADDSKITVIDLAQELVPRELDASAPLTGRNGQATLLRLRQGNVVGVALPLHEPRPGFPNDVTAETAYHDLERWLSQPGSFYSPGCKGAGEGIHTWLTLDGASELARYPQKIGLWVARGVRIFGLVGGTDNVLATSWNDPPPGPVVGLSALGRDVVRRIYEAGGIVDITSGSAMTREDVLAIARTMNGPVVAISANARAKADDPRNLTDSELRAVGASGGLVAVSFDEVRLVRGRTPKVRDLVRQIQYVARIAGIEHVALGSGYEGVRPPDGLETAARFPQLARALLASGMRRDAVEAVFHRNALRVLCPVTAPKPPVRD
jgi:membrane dipeptidase